MGQGAGTWLEPLRLSRLLAEPLGASPAPPGRPSPRAMRTGGAQQRWGGSGTPVPAPRGGSARGGRDPKHSGDGTLNHLGDRGHGRQVFPLISAAAMDTIVPGRARAHTRHRESREMHLGPPAAAFPRSRSLSDTPSTVFLHCCQLPRYLT